MRLPIAHDMTGFVAHDLSGLIRAPGREVWVGRTEVLQGLSEVGFESV